MKRLFLASALLAGIATAALAYTFAPYPDYPAECSAIQNRDKRRSCESSTGFRDEVRAVTAQNKQMCDSQPTSAERSACYAELEEYTDDQKAEYCAAGLTDERICGN